MCYQKQRTAIYTQQSTQNRIGVVQGGFMSTKRISRRQKRQQELQVENVFNKKFAMKRILPITKNQEKMVKAYNDGLHIANIGSAGTGKTYLSLVLALEDVMEKEEYEQIIIIRSAVQSREQGFMPGSLTEKMGYYETPYLDIVNDLFERNDAYTILKTKGMLKFMSTSFIRGLTFDNSIIIVDEAQNCSFQELDTVITRVGESSKIIFCGDMKQDDLKISKHRADVSGLQDFIKVISKLDDFAVVTFGVDDIVRSGLVKQYIIAKEIELELA
jgi:phosphate starvation-inducible PhoH-like protein